jgi:hypothetical protein
MIPLLNNTKEYISNLVHLASTNMPKTKKELKTAIENKTGVFQFIPVTKEEISKMISIYNLHTHPNPTWVKQYTGRDTYGKSSKALGNYEEDGRVRTKIEEGTKYYAEEDLKMFGKFDILYSIIETQKVVGKLEIPSLELNMYTRFNILEKGKDMDMAKTQVMSILSNEFMQIRLADPEFRKQLKGYLKENDK